MSKTIRKIASFLLCLALLIQSGALLATAADTAAGPLPETTLSNSDKQTEWNAASSTYITLNGDTAAVEGTGASVDEGIVTITEPGVYVVSGTLNDGQIIVTLSKEDKAQLVLNGVDITCKTSAPIYGTSCDKLIITLPEGTINTLTDGGDAFVYADPKEEEPNAALFCKDDLTINGTGFLRVKGGFHNGIGTKDDLVIAGASLDVEALNHALRGNDSILLSNATVKLTAGGDGMQTNNAEEADRGWIVMDGGTADITAAKDAMQADTALTINGGVLSIVTGGGTHMNGNIPASSTAADSTSCKGLKSDGKLTIAAGSLSIDSYDDCINAVGPLAISGGAMTLSTADDAIRSDTELTISGGNIVISSAYEGLEAADITISGGDVQITSADDAINAAGAGEEESAESDHYGVLISGGKLTIVTNGDGIDSDANIEIAGGETSVLVSSTRGHKAMEVNGSIIMRGGSIVYGGSDTANSPAGVSSQSYAFVGVPVTAGQEVAITKDGQVLVKAEPTLDCPYLAFSTPEIKAGEVYEILLDGEAIGTVTAGQNELPAK